MRLAIAAVVLVSACTAGGTASPTSTDPGGSSGTTITTAGTAGSSNLTCWGAPVTAASGPIEFVDVTANAGLMDPLTGMHAHTAIWTDIDADNRPDLYVGTFADRPAEVYRHRGADGPSPDRFLISTGASFQLDDSLAEELSRSSGGVTVDLDSDGDLDLVVSRNVRNPERGQPPTTVFENVNASLSRTESGIDAPSGARSVGVLDYDKDGLPDLFIAEDRWTGGGSALLRNEGSLRFTDVTEDVGLPADVHGLGVAIADFDMDGRADIFVSGSNRLFMSDGQDRFIEATTPAFTWDTFGDEDDVAGASVADVNRDGLLDLAVGHHFNSTVDEGTTVAVRLYLNRGHGEFTDVTEEAGLVPLPTKAPHVELNDFDNDGWPDLLTSASASGGPAVFTHAGLDDDLPRFESPTGLGDDQYWVTAPSADFDLDGRLDLFLVEWEPSLPSLLLRNETASGNWLEVSVGEQDGSGIGWRIELFDGAQLIGAREITVTQGYSAGVLPIAHFGLGSAEEVTVRLTPPGSDPVELANVAANQHIRWPDGC